MPEIGYASMAVIPTFKGLQGDLERGSSKALSAAGVSGGAKFGESASKSARSKFSASAKSIVAPLLGAFAAVKVGDFFKDAVQGASDLNESTNKVQQVFGKGTGAVFKFTEGAAKAIGQTNQQARDAAATFGIFGKAAKFTDKQNAKFSIRMTKLASDLASFHNTSPEQAIEAIGAAMRGEAEPIRAYGVLLDEATLKAEAMRIGILKPTKDKNKIISAQVAVTEKQKAYNDILKTHSKNSFEAIKAEGQLGYAQSQLKKATDGTVGPLTQQQKVIAAQSAIMQQTKVAQGDFARTSGGLANQQRILTARWTDAKAAIGTALLPMVNKAVKYLNDEGIPAFERFADFFQKKGIPALQDFGRKATPVVRDVIGKARDFLKEAQPYAEGFVAAFNKLPKGVKTGAAAAALLGFGATKVPGAKGGAGAAAGAAKGILGIVTKAKPLPVYVVNEGFGLPGKPKPKTPGSPLPPILGFPLPGASGINAEVTDPFKPKGPMKVPFTDTKIGGPAPAAPKAIPDSKLSMSQLKAEYASVLKDGTGKGLEADKARLQQIQAAMDALKAKTAGTKDEVGKFSGSFDAGIVKAQHLNNEVKLIGSNARSSRAEVAKLLAALDKARSDGIKLDQGVSGARISKVDRQLGGGGMYVANMNVHGTSLAEVQRDAGHKHRARAMGAESFKHD